MKKLREEKAQAELEILRAEMAEKRAKQAETSEHNTEYKATPSTPDNIKNTKTRTGPSRPEHNADHKNEQTPDNRPKTKAKLDLRLIKTYHHSLQVKHHLDVKINQKTIILNRITNLKENEVGHEILNQIQILKDQLLLKRTKT